MFGDSSLCDFLNGDYKSALKHCTLLLGELDDYELETRRLLLVNRATCYLHLGLSDNCIQDAQNASKIDPNWFRPIYLIIKALVLSNGKRADAVNLYNTWRKTSGLGDICLQEEIHSLLFPQENKKQQQEKRKDLSVRDGKCSSTSQLVPKIECSTSTNKSKNESKNGSGNQGKTDSADCQIIETGYSLIRDEKIEEGLTIFNNLLSSNSEMHDARIGRAFAYRAQGNHDKAFKELNYILTKDSEHIDALSKSAQLLISKGIKLEVEYPGSMLSSPPSKEVEELQKKAIQFLTKAINVIWRKDLSGPEAFNQFFQRGVIYKALGDFESAIIDFKEVIKREPKHKLAYNALGGCYTNVGSCLESRKAFTKGIKIDPNDQELWHNLGRSHQNYGNYKKAEKYFAKSISIAKYYPAAYSSRSLLRYFSGRMELAIEDFNTIQRQEKITDYVALGMRGTAYMSLGQFRLAMKNFNMLLAEDTEMMKMCWYRREMLPLYQKNLDLPFSEYNLDIQLHPSLKEMYIRDAKPNLLSAKYIRNNHLFDESISDVNLKSLSLQQKELRDSTHRLSRAMRYNCPGFMQNIRFHRMCGLAVMEVAQTIKKYWKKPFEVSGKASSGNQNPHIFGWRDMMDIAIRWRQYCEPNDIVFWLDLVEKSSFDKGVHLFTPIINKQMKNPKYYCYFVKCFNLLKMLVLINRKVDNYSKMQITKCKTIAEIYKIIGDDFSAVTPCDARSGHGFMAGTLLAVNKTKYGHQFAIQTPGTPGRWGKYSKELRAVFDDLAENAKQRSQKHDLEKSVELSLIFYFYWVNFGALSRGTAATGGIILHALIIANGYLVTNPMPEGKQMDWEAITSRTHTEFINIVRGWLNVIPLSQDSNTIPLDSLPNVSAHVSTLRDMITILNNCWQKKHISNLG